MPRSSKNHHITPSWQPGPRTATGGFIMFAQMENSLRVGTGPAAGATFVMHLNIPGMARCAIAVGNDLKMGLKKDRTRNRRLAVYQNMIDISEAKLYYKQANSWVEVDKTEKAIEEMCEEANKVAVFYVESMNAMLDSMQNISNSLGPAIDINPKIAEIINDIL